ncbi:MAG: class I SAM-dependent methyltransferase [Woeseiaceae bacterium]|nr:class I SAM-dependent methyltransferase [Woeseiaceae bacterium]
MTDRPFSEYAERNSGPILDVLRNEFSTSAKVLEIGSGTGQHAVRFASELPHLQWQTSDRAENHEGIRAWVETSALRNLLPPLSLDVLTADIPPQSWDAIFSANTAHIMSIKAVTKMFQIVSIALGDGGVFCLYGPFRQGGEFNTDSNAAFDQSLRARDPEMGIRDIEFLDDLGTDNNLLRLRLYAMPANNHIAVWIKGAV